MAAPDVPAVRHLPDCFPCSAPVTAELPWPFWSKTYVVMERAARVEDAVPPLTAGLATFAQSSVADVRTAFSARTGVLLLKCKLSGVSVALWLLTTTTHLPFRSYDDTSTPSGAPVTLCATEPGRTNLLYWPSA